MMRICISGLSSSGKTTLGYTLAKELNIMHITKHMVKSFKDFEEDQKRNNEIVIVQTADKRYADAFDREVIELAEKNNCVVTTWLAPWIIKDPTLRIWLTASFEERVRRHAKDKKKSIKESEEFIKKKDSMTIQEFKNLYKIDVMDHSNFDLEINNERFEVKDVASTIAMLALTKEKIMFR